MPANIPSVDRERTISVMTNAIAFSLEGGVEGQITVEDVEPYRIAAERAYRQGIEGKD